jgi:hypothetical protein
VRDKNVWNDVTASGYRGGVGRDHVADLDGLGLLRRLGLGVRVRRRAVAILAARFEVLVLWARRLRL